MADARSAQVYETIFDAELDDWHRDTGTQQDEQFIGERRTVLEGVQPLQ
jgi:hypothetical protein